MEGKQERNKTIKQITQSYTLTSQNPYQTVGYERKRDYRIHLEVDPTEPWIFSLGKNTQCQ